METSHTFSGLAAATNYTIEARTVDNVGRTSSVYTKTIQSGSIKVTGITLANKTLTKTSTTNPTVTITPTITPSNATNKGVTWSSSNPGVATVNTSGVVTYVSVGTTTITATAQDGSGVKGTCIVTCSEDKVASTIDKNNFTISISAGWNGNSNDSRNIPLDLTGVSKIAFDWTYKSYYPNQISFGVQLVIR